MISSHLLSLHNQVRMKESDSCKTAFNTKYGQFEYRVIPFGLCNAPATFQRMMNETFHDMIDDCVIIYLDDILVYSISWKQHLLDVEKVLKRLRNHSLFAKRSKCEFGKERLPFLGHVISSQGLETEGDKIAAVVGWKTPTCVKQVQSFLGLVNYYRRFIKGCSLIALPLTELTKKNVRFRWTESQRQAFQKLKSILTSSRVMAHPNPNKLFEIRIDASEKAIGGVLEQEGRPVAYISKVLNSAEQNYVTHEQEILALIIALQKWRVYLENKSFKVYSDSTFVTQLQNIKQPSKRQLRWIQILDQYHYEIAHVKGKENVVADALSRKNGDEDLMSLGVSSVNFDNDLIEMIKRGYQNDEYFREMYKELSLNETSLKYKNFLMKEELLYFKTPEQHLRICVPRLKHIHLILLKEYHDSLLGGHQGISRTEEMLQRNFYWPHMHKTICQYIKSCDSCQRSKISTEKTAGLLNPLPIPVGLWKTVSMDFITKLPKSKRGNDAILVVVDKLSKMIVTVAMKEATSENPEIVAQLFFEQVFRHHGMPNVIISDRDPRFVSLFWKGLMNVMDTKLAMTTAHRAQADGQTERMNQSLKTMIRQFVNYKQDNWDDLLYGLEFVYNNHKNMSTGQSPFMLNYGFHPKIPGTLLQENDNVQPKDISTFMEKRQQMVKTAQDALQDSLNVQAQQANKHKRDVVFNVGDQVLLSTQDLNLASDSERSKKLTDRFCGPFEILERIGESAYKLKLPPTMECVPTFNVDRLKLYVEPNSFDESRQEKVMPDVIDEEEEYEVEKIVKERKYGQKKHIQYMVKYKGYPNSSNEWLFAEDIKESCSKVIDDWKQTHN